MKKATRKTEIAATWKALKETEGKIVQMLTAVEHMRRKQIARQQELARQLGQQYTQNQS